MLRFQLHSTCAHAFLIAGPNTCYIFFFLTNPPRSTFCILLNQLVSHPVYVSKSKIVKSKKISCINDFTSIFSGGQHLRGGSGNRLIICCHCPPLAIFSLLRPVLLPDLFSLQPVSTNNIEIAGS